MQWTMPSISSKRAAEPGGGSSKPKRLITPSTSTASSGRVKRAPSLPAVVSEGLVGLGHAVDVVLALPGGALLFGRVEDLCRQPVRHRVLAAAAGVVDEPAHRK